MRRGPWKLLLDEGLFHVEHDISEQWDQRKRQPELAAELEALAKELDAAIEAEARPVRKVSEMAFDPRKLFGGGRGVVQPGTAGP